MINETKYFILDRAPDSSWKGTVKRALAPLAARTYRCLMDLYHPGPQPEKKYRVAICAIFKNEGPYFREWLEFHRIVGVDHFYLYNNNSDDNFREILAPYIAEGLVTLIEWPQQQAQMQAYWDCIARFRGETRWIGFIDLDEYVVPRKMDTIYEALQPMEKNRPAVMLYWRVFGSSGRMVRDRTGLVTEDFTVCWPKYDSIGKMFYNTAYDPAPDAPQNSAMHHRQWARYNGILMPPVNMDDMVCIWEQCQVKSDDFPIQINHYFTKSYQEYGEKRARGDVYFKINPHDEAYFFEHEMRCTATDYSAYRFLIHLKKKMKEVTVNN